MQSPEQVAHVVASALIAAEVDPDAADKAARGAALLHSSGVAFTVAEVWPLPEPPPSKSSRKK